MADILNFPNSDTPFQKELHSYLHPEMQKLLIFSTEMVAKHLPDGITSEKDLESASIVFAAIMTEEWHGSLERKAVEWLGEKGYAEMVERLFAQMTLKQKRS
jgi:hypothetical protein